MAAASLTETYDPGDLIFRAGDRGSHAYVIDTGEVGIFVPDDILGEKQVATLRPGEIFGEMAIIDDRPRSATARALDRTRLTVVSRVQISSRIEDADPVIRLLIQVLMKRLRSSIGVTDSTADIDNSDETETLTQSQTMDRIKLGTELERAVLDRQFEMYYQPIIDLKANAIAGFEGLIRWNHPERGMVPPNSFIGLAEESDLIIPIGRWVLDQAMAALARFDALARLNQPEWAPMFMGINVSARQFNDANFFTTLQRSLSRNKVPGEQIKLEITERALIADVAASRQIEVCKSLGCQVALDDFGTGYSSLSYLSKFPIDALKIDQSFVSNMLTDRRAMAIIRSVIGLADGLTVPTIAEGIETVQQLTGLRVMGCRFAQGYLFSRPLPQAEAERYAANFTMPQLPATSRNG